MVAIPVCEKPDPKLNRNTFENCAIDPAGVPRKIIVISGPTCVGKTTVVKHLCEVDDRFERIVTCTSRKPRDGEVQDRDYRFYTLGQMETMIGCDAFIEHTIRADGIYGLRVTMIESALDRGRIPVLILDPRGFDSVRKSEYGNDTMGIFLFPPSWMTIHKRLIRRGYTLDERTVRAMAAQSDIGAAWMYDYFLVNHDFCDTAIDIINIVDGGVK